LSISCLQIVLDNVVKVRWNLICCKNRRMKLAIHPYLQRQNKIARVEKFAQLSFAIEFFWYLHLHQLDYFRKLHKSLVLSWCSTRHNYWPTWSRSYCNRILRIFEDQLNNLIYSRYSNIYSMFGVLVNLCQIMMNRDSF